MRRSDHLPSLPLAFRSCQGHRGACRPLPTSHSSSSPLPGVLTAQALQPHPHLHQVQASPPTWSRSAWRCPYPPAAGESSPGPAGSSQPPPGRPQRRRPAAAAGSAGDGERGACGSAGSTRAVGAVRPGRLAAQRLSPTCQADRGTKAGPDPLQRGLEPRSRQQSHTPHRHAHTDPGRASERGGTHPPRLGDPPPAGCPCWRRRAAS
jgi:hypothetical protein